MIRLLAALGLICLLTATARAQDMPFTQVLIDGEDWQLVGQGYKFTEGPSVNAKGEVFFTDVPSDKIYKVDLQGKVTVFVDNAARPSGTMFRKDGRLIANRGSEKKIVAYKPDGSFDVIAQDVNCNDLVVASTGDIYVTDVPNKSIIHISPAGEKRVVASGWRPNGLTLWPDEATLVITDSDATHLWTYRVEADGSLKFGEKYYHPVVSAPTKYENGKLQFGPPGSDGMKVDDAGRLYLASRAGVQMWDPTGRLGGVIACPQNKPVSNLVFGGAKFDTMYVTCVDKVYKRQTKVTSTPYFLKADKPAAGKKQ
ncbi:MAG: SMP-30/gluconolactonase/LRE family protein [Phycisphaeraceae bacterium]